MIPISRNSLFNLSPSLLRLQPHHSELHQNLHSPTIAGAEKGTRKTRACPKLARQPVAFVELARRTIVDDHLLDSDVFSPRLGGSLVQASTHVGLYVDFRTNVTAVYILTHPSLAISRICLVLNEA
ncbi:hypothetical protein LY78DRAFT_44562 [Colletotrichum sublineola]|nr:hypothetical protein LY78DRAFT_44562 [Colletotrichum sublineola]